METWNNFKNIFDNLVIIVNNILVIILEIILRIIDKKPRKTIMENNEEDYEEEHNNSFVKLITGTLRHRSVNNSLQETTTDIMNAPLQKPETCKSNPPTLNLSNV
jgi:kynurenine formamidase